MNEGRASGRVDPRAEKGGSRKPGIFETPEGNPME